MAKQERPHKEPHQESSAEKFHQIDLTIEEPVPGLHNWSIQFESNSRNLCRAYNRAVEEITKGKNLAPFHQGGGANDNAGWHKWEFWADTSKEQLTSLFEEIHSLARGKYDLHKELGLHNE